jgi:hypothetical protein
VDLEIVSREKIGAHVDNFGGFTIWHKGLVHWPVPVSRGMKRDIQER